MTSRIKIVLLIGEFHPPWSDGYLSYSRGLVEALQRIRGAEVTVLATINTQSIAKATDSDIREFNKITSVSKVVYLHRESSAQPLRVLLGLNRNKDVASADIIHVEYEKILPSWLPFFLSSSCLRNKTVLKHICGPPNTADILKTLFLQKFGKTLGTVCRFRSELAFSSEYIASCYEVRGGTVIPPAINDEFFKPINCKVTANKINKVAQSDDQKILFFGKMTPERFPHKEILSALKLLEKDHKIKAQLIVIGRGDPKEQNHLKEILSLAERLNIRDRVDVRLHTLNEREKVNILNEVGAFLFPYARPQLLDVVDPPISVLEAMSCGKVVVSTPVGSLHSIIQNGQNGFLLWRVNHEELAKKLSMSLDRAISKRVGINARDTILRKFSLSTISNDLCHIYKQRS